MIDCQLNFSQIAGEFAESIGFNRSVGQIYGHLYLSREPQSLSDIAKDLSMSKGNASLNLRVLASWGAVFPVTIQGSRQDHYVANKNIREISARRLQEGFEKRLNMVDNKLKKLLEENPNQSSHKQIKELHTMVINAQKGIRMLPKILSLVGL